MTIKQILKREWFVAVHAQSAKFRVYKYAVIALVSGVVYYVFGSKVLLWVFVVSFFFALVIHFVFRWKTKSWTKSWGPYKYIPLDKI